jgi:putative ATP-binding cassette transporter
MNLIRFLFRYSRQMMIWTLLAALLSGACNAGLIAMVNAVLNSTGLPSGRLLWCFVALCAVRLFTNFLAQITLTHFAQQSTADLRREIVRKILAVPLRLLEETGASRVMVALTEDIMNITQALLIIPAFAVNLAILAGGAVYLGWLSPRVLVMLFGFIFVGAVAYRLLIRSGFKHLELAHEEEGRLFRHFRALTEGIKELKLHRERRAVFLSDNIQSTTAEFQRHTIAAEMRFIIAQNWSHLLFFSLVGLILFLLPKMESINPHALTGYVVATLYLMGPLSGLLGSLSAFGRASVSLSKIDQLGLALTARVQDDRAVAPGRPPAFEHLELVQVTHSYHCEKDDNHFMLGPINLSFHAGELVFLVGGNGSGKSTLAKVITGLYPPADGEIRLNGEAITVQNRDDYRQYFSAVFADFYLFDNLLGLDRPNLDAQAQSYLEQLHLEHKVKIRHGRLSTTELSQGQRKRLALLTAYLEDRPFYLFDEWASDQDPLFKELFYTQLLPELKSRGKAVLVITHDDRYFHLADRIVKLDYGQITTKTVDQVCDPV